MGILFFNNNSRAETNQGWKNLLIRGRGRTIQGWGSTQDTEWKRQKFHSDEVKYTFYHIFNVKNGAESESFYQNRIVLTLFQGLSASCLI